MATVEYSNNFLLQGLESDLAALTAVPGMFFYCTDSGILYMGTTVKWVKAGGENIFLAYDSAGVTLDGTARAIALATTLYTGSFYTLASTTVTINRTGLYKVSANWGWKQLDLTGGTRADAHCWMQEDPLGVGSWAAIPESEGGGYSRETTDYFGVSCTFFRNFTDTDKVRMLWQRINDTMTLVGRANATRLNIEFRG